MNILSKEELLALARLSRLELDESEVTSLAKQIEDVLAYAQRVQEVAKEVLRDEELLKNINIMREDLVIKTNPEPLLSQAPDREQNYFVVPVIIEN